MKKILLLSGALLFCFSCSTVRIVDFEDHPSKPVTRMETVKTTTFFWSTTVEREFWLCDNKELSIECSRLCGGETGLDCPSSVNGLLSASLTK